MAKPIILSKIGEYNGNLVNSYNFQFWNRCRMQIMSSVQYYPEDIIAYAIMSAGRFCICNRVRPDTAA